MRFGPKELIAALLLPAAILAASPVTPCAPESIREASHLSLPLNGRVVENSTDSAQTNETPPPAPERPTAVSSTSSGPVVIDNDLATGTQVEESVRWEDLPDEPGRTHISAGARFPVASITELNSKTAKAGDPFQARLKVDLKIGGRLIAPRGAIVNGHVRNVERSRSYLHAEFSPKRWLRANGAIGLQFDEILTDNEEHLPLTACPATQSRIVKNKNEGRVLGVNNRAEVVGPLSTQLKAQALHLAIRGAASAGGVFSMGAVPVAYGVIGFISPSFAFLHPVGKNVPHRRLKGFAMGVVSGLPGGFLIADAINKGQEAIIKPGDEFLAEFKQDFNGEASTAAELIPGATKKVHGEVVKKGASPNM